MVTRVTSSSVSNCVGYVFSEDLHFEMRQCIPLSYPWVPVTYCLHPWILTSYAGLLTWQQRRVMLVIHGWSLGQQPLASSILILSRKWYFTPSTTPGTSLMLPLPYARLQVKDWYELFLPSSSLWSSNQELPILHLSWSTPLSVSAVCMCRASFTINSCPQPSTTLQNFFLVKGVTTHPAKYKNKT